MEDVKHILYNKTCYKTKKKQKKGRDMGEGNGTPLQYCCPENPMDGGAW